MKTKQYRIIIRSLLLIIIAMLAALQHPLPSARATAGAQSQAASTMEDRWAAIDSYVEHERQAAQVPGLALGIVQGDRIVHLMGFGEADPSGRAVTGQTPFSIGSATKSFTALAIMQLVEAGKLKLDAPVQRYLPWFRVADSEASARITVRHLLHHTTGLPRPVGNMVVTMSNTSDQALEEQVRSFSSAELTQPVGATWQYSNAGYATLGLLVQTVSGQSYERYVEQHIFAPLLMRRSFTAEEPARQAGLTAGYRYWFGMPVAGGAPFARGALPAGFLMSSAEDMAHYLIAQLNGGRYENALILSPAGIAEMQQGAVAVPNEGGLGYDDAKYGMGWFTGTRNGIAIVAHPGDTANFHADVILMPESQLGIVMLMNSNNRMAGERMRGIAYGVASLLQGQQPSPIETNSSATDLLRIMVVITAVQALAMVGSAITLRRFVRRTSKGVVGGWVSVVRHVVLPLLLYLPLALMFLVGVPLIFAYPWPLLLLTLPDIGWVALIAGVLALGWSLLQTGVVLSALRKRRAMTAIAGPARA